MKVTAVVRVVCIRSGAVGVGAIGSLEKISRLGGLSSNSNSNSSSSRVGALALVVGGLEGMGCGRVVLIISVHKVSPSSMRRICAWACRGIE